MESNKVKIYNATEHNIIVFLKLSEDANIPDIGSGGATIEKKMMKEIYCKGGTMNLFVFKQDSTLDWMGIIPTKINKLVEIHNDKDSSKFKVVYDDIILPSGFNPVTNPNRHGFIMEENQTIFNMINSSNITIIAVIIAISIGIIYWMRKK